MAGQRRWLQSWRTKAQPELALNITDSLAQLQKEHVLLELEGLDRMQLNASVPKLTSKGGMAAFFAADIWDTALPRPSRRWP